MKLHEMKQNVTSSPKICVPCMTKLVIHRPMSSVLSGTLQNRSLTPLMSVLHAKRNCAADQDYIHENEPEQRQQQNRDPANPEAQANERRAAAFNAFCAVVLVR